GSMQRTRRRLVGVVARWGAGATGATALGACGVPASGAPPATARRAVTLQFWSRFPAPIQDVEEKNLPVFMERSAPIKVERTLAAVDYGQLVEKITTAFASDTAPDVFTMGSPDVVTYAHPGSALQLDAFPRVRKEAEDFFGPPLAVGRYKEKLYGLTYYIDTRIMVYRKDLLAEEGLPTDRKQLPKTWEQFREVGRKLAKWEGGQLSRVGWDIATSGDATQFMMMLAQQKKNIIAADGKRVEFDGPEGQRALQTLVDFVHRDRLDSPQRPQFPSGVEALGTSMMAIKWTNSDILARIRRAQMEPDQTIVTDLSPEFSGQPTAASYMGGTWIMAAKGTKDTDATLDLVTYLTGLEHTLALAEATTTVPARKSAEKAPYLQNPLLRPFYESLQYGWSVPQHPKYAQIRAKVIEATREAMQQQKGVGAALTDAGSYANALLAGS
ncbi:MAG: extracellular solute-binding protein, partial [Chloroflexota bacterium]|nr:extracellular solute-binding protein [Chloroflexota bacterium]